MLCLGIIVALFCRGGLLERSHLESALHDVGVALGFK